jgi:hypothetical protein
MSNLKEGAVRDGDQSGSSIKLALLEDQVEVVVKEICADEESGDEIMIPELDEVDNDNTVIDSDTQDSNHEHLVTTSAVSDMPTSWTNRDVVQTIAQK